MQEDSVSREFGPSLHGAKGAVRHAMHAWALTRYARAGATRKTGGFSSICAVRRVPLKTWKITSI